MRREWIGLGKRLIAASVRRPSTARLRSACVLAVVGPVVVAVALVPFGELFALSSYLLFVLLIVVAAAAVGGPRPALAALVTGLAAGFCLHLAGFGGLQTDVDLVKLAAFAVVGTTITVLIGEQARLAQEHAAVRRVATLVARAAPTQELFAVVTEEAAQLLAADFATLSHHETDGTSTLLSEWARDESSELLLASDPFGGGKLLTIVAETGYPARIDLRSDDADPPVGSGRVRRVRSAAGAPVVVDDHLWGVLIVGGSRTAASLPPDTEARLSSFTDLVATAIANVESRGELAASRARIVVAADETRRRIERDLHDGAQQRLISLGLQVRAAQTARSEGSDEVDRILSQVADGLADVQYELMEMARGIHPAILAKGGLAPALKTLARRSPVAVELDLRVDQQLSERVEVPTYYVVSEALTNAAKHARASIVRVEVRTIEQTLRAQVHDDGVGGADPARGSGLIGLRDRVEAFGGTITIQSPRGAGTTLRVELPLDGDGIEKNEVVGLGLSSDLHRATVERTPR